MGLRYMGSRVFWSTGPTFCNGGNFGMAGERARSRSGKRSSLRDQSGGRCRNGMSDPMVVCREKVIQTELGSDMQVAVGLLCQKRPVHDYE